MVSEKFASVKTNGDFETESEVLQRPQTGSRFAVFSLEMRLVAPHFGHFIN